MDVAGFRAVGRCRSGRFHICQPEIVERGEEVHTRGILARVDAGRAGQTVFKDVSDPILA